jgi:hypothetical protein
MELQGVTKNLARFNKICLISLPYHNFWAKNENTRARGKIYFILFEVYLTWILKI